MSEKKIRLNKLTKELNVGIDRILSFLVEKGHDGLNPTSKISEEIYQLLLNEFQLSKQAKMEAKIVAVKRNLEKESKEQESSEEIERIKTKTHKLEVKNIGFIDVAETKSSATVTQEPTIKPKVEQNKVIKAKADKLETPKLIGTKIDLDKIERKLNSLSQK